MSNIDDGPPVQQPLATPAASPESTAHPRPTPRPQIDDCSLPQIGDWLVSEDAAANLGSHDIPPPDISVPNKKQLAFISNPEQMPRQQFVPSGSLGSPTDATNTSSKGPATTHNLAGQQNNFAGYEFEWLSPQSGQPPPSAGQSSWRATPHSIEFNLERPTTLLGGHSQQPTWPYANGGHIPTASFQAIALVTMDGNGAGGPNRVPPNRSYQMLPNVPYQVSRSKGFERPFKDLFDKDASHAEAAAKSASER
ncbi:hypothetical protein DL770_009171 [Monosporascus sp. CRB-9-2]|nr:hypothetical protein DL770_009171 [Monosporascus sp. CRB-9-2]